MSDQDKFTSLIEWAEKNGSKFVNKEKLFIQNDPVKGVGVCSCDLECDSVSLLLTLSKECIIDKESILDLAEQSQHDSLKSAIKLFLNRNAELDPRILFVLFFVYGKYCVEHDIDNFWSPYLSLLPKIISVPSAWSDYSREYLRGTSLYLPAKEKAMRLDREWKHFVSLENDFAKSTALNDWIHADALFWSRAFYQTHNNGIMMLPFIDLLNHRPEADRNCSWIKFPELGENIEYISLVRIPNNETENNDENIKNDDFELYISYGDKPAAEMLYLYGFLPENVSNNLMLYFPASNNSNDPLFHIKTMIFEPMVKLTVLENGDIDWMNSGFLWLSVVNEEDGLVFKKENDSIIAEIDDFVICSSDCSETRKDIQAKELIKVLQGHRMWDIFKLRALMTITDMLFPAIYDCDSYPEVMEDTEQEFSFADGLRRQERLLVRIIEENLWDKRQELIENSSIIRNYLQNL